MVYDLQKGNIWKRISAWLFDSILVCILAVGIACVLSAMLNYDSYSTAVENAYIQYETQYGTSFSVSEADFASMTPAQQEAYTNAYNALIADDQAMYDYNMMLNLTLLITTASILIAIAVLEFALPLVFGNGQTLGKKIFGLCLVRTDGVRVTRLQLLLRTLLGKFTLETMIPVYILVLFFWGTLNLWGTVILLGLLLAQILCLGLSKTNAALHDLLAGTAVVDRESQMIFATAQERLAYVKRVAAERAAKEPY